MSEWRSACVTAPYPPELLPNTPRRPLPPHLKRCSIAGSISSSRKSSQAPIEAELMYWLPPSRVKQSGKATRSTSRGKPCPSCPAGTYTSTPRTHESPNMLFLRAWLLIVTRLMEPLDPKNLRMRLLLASADINPHDEAGKQSR